MKKRIRKKLIKKRNLARHKVLFDQIKKDFTVKDETFRDSYFFYHFGKNSICHFSIKETPDWLYGIWLSEDSFQLFGEHIDFIDKFKPSRTYLSCEDDIERFLSQIHDISKRPDYHLAAVISGGAVDTPYESIDGFEFGYQVSRTKDPDTGAFIVSRDESITLDQFISKVVEEHRIQKVKEKEEIESARKMVFEFFPTLLEKSSHFLKVGVLDRVASSGMYCSPRYDILILSDGNLPDEEADTLLEKIDDLCWNISDQDLPFTHNQQVSLRGIYFDEKPFNRCQYIFK